MEIRQPEVGDKFATLNGQKGVITAILPDDTLPRDENGVVPDVFFGPHGFIDRLTASFHGEVLLGLVS